MNLKSRTLALSLILGAAVDATSAIGFGRLPTSAVLGQPLQLAIALHLDPGEAIGSECLLGEVHFADSLQQPGTTSLRLDPALPSATERVLRLTTTTRVDEPLVTVEVSVGCTSKVTRRFVLFADPPVVALADTPADAPATEEAAAAVTAPAAPAVSSEPAAEQVRAPQVRASAPAAPRRSAALARRPSSATTPTPATIVRREIRASRPARRVAQASSARLKLAPLEAGAAAPAVAVPPPAPTAPSAAVAEQAASAAAVSAAADAAARARVVELEAAVGKLRSDTASAQQSIQGLQSRLQRAEDGRFSNPLVYALLALLALLMGAVLWLWRQRNQEREAHAWLAHAAATSASAESSVGQPETSVSAPVPTLKAWVSKPSPVDGFDETRSLTKGPTALPSDSLVSGSVPLGGVQPLSAAQRREVSVEELIDLEQQAEFFVVLGQDAAAIELLMGHLRSTAGSSPLPYLKLLEIHKRLGDREEYARLRERFNTRFNAYAPPWETDLQAGRSLEEYPAVIERLEGLWFMPQRALEVLEATLLRADGGHADDADAQSFDLPAYRELMLLYSVARDRSEAESDTAIDLMLPLADGEGALDGKTHGGVFERLLATTPLTAQPSVQKSLEVDLPLDDFDPGPTEHGALPLLSTRDRKRSEPNQG